MSPEFEKLHRLMTDAKCSLLLNNARKRVKHIVSEDHKLLSGVNVERLVKHQMIQKLTTGVVENIYNKIEMTNTHLGDEYELDIVVIPTSDLKSVVNYLVQNMALEDLLRIREYGKDDNLFKL
jgi:hypothetical protein